MDKHIHGPTNAFQMFDSAKSGVLTFEDFSSLIEKLHQAAFKEVPTYQIMKDLYDEIDV